MEAWEEALDLDESDFTSILRPCNTQQLPPSGHNSTDLHSSPNLQTLINTSQHFPPKFPSRHFPSQQEPSQSASPASQLLVGSKPSESECSAKRRRVHQSLALSSGTAETLSDSQLPLRIASDAARPRTIPGPAGLILAALQRRSEIRATESEDQMSEISTQEYLRKAVEGEGDQSQFDDDFKKQCWVAALDFAYRLSIESTCDTTVPLGSINNRGTRKLPKVITMIKTCTPNGFGDFRVTLKDPSGTICGTIHRSVLMEENNASCLSVGAVLVLQKVSIFCPRAICYLNITQNNVVKIFPKNFDPSSNSGSGSEEFIDCRGNELTNRGACNQTDGTVSNLVRPSLNEQLEENNWIKDAAFKPHQDIEKQKEPMRGFIVSDRSTSISNRKQSAAMGGNNQSMLRCEQPGEANIKKRETSVISVESNGASKQMQPLASLPEWTDEQLEELLIDD